jgi:TPR repeat protein
VVKEVLNADCPRRRIRGAWPVVLGLACLLAMPCLRAASSGHLTTDAVYDPQALRALAEQGDKRAAFLLGSRFSSGRSGVRDDSEAVRWFSMAAEGGLAEAQYNLGIMYASGRGVPRDYAQAAQWYERAAEQGLAEAQFNLGTLHGLGRGVPRNEVLAVRWLERAARKGLAEAQYNLGALYEHGRGVRLDGHRALEWYRQAADQGFEPAQVRHAALSKKLALPTASAKDRSSPGSGKQVPPAQASVSDPRPKPAPAPTVPVKATVATSEPAALASPEAAQTNASSWVASLGPARYTLQLASFGTRGDAMRFMKTLPENRGKGVYAAVKRGKLWFSVVYGSWESFDAAKAAVATLPARIGKMKPWVRKVALIQEQMN